VSLQTDERGAATVWAAYACVAVITLLGVILLLVTAVQTRRHLPGPPRWHINTAKLHSYYPPGHPHAGSKSSGHTPLSHFPSPSTFHRGGKSLRRAHARL